MSYQVDSYGNAYFPAGVSVASIPATTGTQNKVLVPGPGGRISSASIAQLITQSGGNLVSSVYGRTGAVVARQGDYNTDLVTEGQALYFTDSRARKALSVTTFNTSGPATYDSTTGIINIPQYGSGIVGNYVPVTRTITINGQTADLSANRIFSIDSMVYPSAGIPLSNGISWGTSIVNNSANWNTAFGWGDHSVEGYLTSFTETDPTVASHIKAITTTNITNWNSAYSWGNHALAGYLTSFTETDPIWTSEKINYYTKLQADARYLQSYTETDPVWTSEKVNYYTKTAADARYLQSYTETDPVWTSEKANYALKTYVDTSISNLVDSAPGTLDTLNELAAALGDDANFSTTITTLIGTKEPAITAGTTAQYWRGDKTWQTLPVYTLSGLGGVPTTRTLTINGTSYDLSADRSWSITSMIYPSAGIAVSTGSAWGTSITDNSSNWNTAYSWGNHASAGYLTASSAASTYLTISNASSTYLSQSSANSIYLNKTDAASTYLSQSSANTIYLNKTDAASTYLSQSSAASLYLSITNASSTYLSQSSAALTYVSLSGSYSNPSWVTSLAWSKITGAPAFITSYTETDTLSSVTSRGASTSTAVTFSGGASISSLLINGATAWTEGSLALGAHSADEGGQLVLNKATSYTYAAHIDVWHDVLRFLYGTNTATSGVAMSLNLSTKQLILPQYTTSSTFTGTAAGVLAFDSSGNILTIAVPGGAVSSVNAGTGVSVNSNTGAVTVSIGQSVATSASPTFNQIITTNNGGSNNVKLGDDAWIGDTNVSNTVGIVGIQNSDRAYISFGSDNTVTLGRIGTGALTWGGNNIWHAGNLTNLNQLINGPGYITGYTETSTLANVTARGASTSTRTTFVEVGVTKAGSDSVAVGPWFRWTNVAEDRQMLTQLNASNGLTWWSYNGSAWASRMILHQGGQLVLNNGVSNGSGEALVIGGSGDVRLSDGASIFFGAYDYGNSTYIRAWDDSNLMRFYINGTNSVTFTSSGLSASAISVGSSAVWHQGNLTNLNQLSNGPGYITSYSETDTLSSVTGRGNTTSSSMAIGSGSIPNGRLYVNSSTSLDVVAIQTTTTGAALVIADNTTPTWANAPRIVGVHNDFYIRTLATNRVRVTDGGNTWLYGDLYLGSSNTKIASTIATGYITLSGSSTNYIGIGPYNNNGWGYFENFNNSNGTYYYVSAGRHAFDGGPVTPYSDGARDLGTSSYRWGNIYTTGALINNSDGAVMMESNASENNNWIFKESSKAWGIFYFNRGSQSGQNIGGSYSSVGAETIFMGQNVGIAMPSGWSGYYNGSKIAAYVDHNTGVMFSAGSMRSPIFYDSDNPAYYLDPNSNSRLAYAQYDNIGVGQAYNSGYRIITSGDIYLNAQGNGWAEGVWKQRRSGGTFYDVIDAGNYAGYNSYSNLYTNTLSVGSDCYAEKVFDLGYFSHGVANIVAYIDFGNIQNSGYLEVEVTSTYSNQNATGLLRKILPFGTNPNGGQWYSGDSKVQEANGSIPDNIFIGDLEWSGSNFRLPIYHVVSSGNGFRARVKYFTQAGNAAGILNGASVSTSTRTAPANWTNNPAYNRAIDTRDIRMFNNNTIGWRYSSGDSGMYNYIYNSYDDTTTGITYRSGNWTSSQGIVCHRFQTYTSGWQNRLTIYQDGGVVIPGRIDAGNIYAPTYYSSVSTSKYLTNNGSSYGSWYIGGNQGGYSGFRFDGDMQLMMHTNGAAGPCGFWLNNWSILTYVNAAQYLYNNGSEKFRTASDGIVVTGTVYATGDVIAYYSDIRLKKDVTVIDSALDKIQRLRGVTYTWNDEEVNKVKDRAGTRDIGLIAQEVEAVEPLLITEYQTQLNTPSNDPDEANNFVAEMSETYKTIKYEKLVALLVEGMKEQQTQIEELKNEIKELKNK